jgi:hypothetical protein
MQLSKDFAATKSPASSCANKHPEVAGEIVDLSGWTSLAEIEENQHYRCSDPEHQLKYH